MNNKKELIIMSGPPCSGKSTFIKKYYPSMYVISRDIIRMDLFGKNYKQNNSSENRISKEEELLLKCSIYNDFIVDNCHCREKYLTALINRFKDTHNIKIVVFNNSLFRLYIRNIIRYLKCGKFIPFKVIKQMKLNQNKIDYKSIRNTIKNETN